MKDYIDLFLEEQEIHDTWMGKTGGYAKDMTMRDELAARAMQGYISARAWHPDYVLAEDFNFDAGKIAANAVAVNAYKYADAMLKAREGK